MWVRPDVYAMHGHYLDCHLTLPTLERIGIGAIGRLLERPESTLASVQDYEAVTSPIYGWRDVMVRYGRAGAALNGVATVRAWRALGGGRGADQKPASPAAGFGRGRQRHGLWEQWGWRRPSDTRTYERQPRGFGRRRR